MKFSSQFSTYFWLSFLTILVAVAVKFCEVTDEEIFNFFDDILNFDRFDDDSSVILGKFKQNLDHYNRTEYDYSFDQKYFVNKKYYHSTASQPVVLLVVSAMMHIKDDILQDKAYIEFAERTNALMLALEPRFYGTSQYFKELTVDNLYYLNAEQSLADLALFKEEIPEVLKREHEIDIPAGAKWVVTGREFGGSHAAWFRLKYPHIAMAAIPVSAPLYVKPNYDESFDRVEETLFYEGMEDMVRESYDKINKMLQATDDTNEPKNLNDYQSDLDDLRNDFMLCAELYSGGEEVEENINQKSEKLLNNYSEKKQQLEEEGVEGIAEKDVTYFLKKLVPQKEGEGEETPEDEEEKEQESEKNKIKTVHGKKGEFRLIEQNVKHFLFMLTHYLLMISHRANFPWFKKEVVRFLQSTELNSYDKFKKCIQLLLVGTDGCIQNDYNEVVKLYLNPKFMTGDKFPLILQTAFGTRPEFYQRCFEFGMFKTAGVQNYFHRYVPIGYYTEFCAQIFNPEMNQRAVESAIYTTNLFYGSLKFEGRNTLFINRKGDQYNSSEVKESKRNNDVVSIVLTDIPDSYKNATDDDKMMMRKYYARIFKPLLRWVGNTDALTELNVYGDEYTDETDQKENIDNIRKMELVNRRWKKEHPGQIGEKLREQRAEGEDEEHGDDEDEEDDDNQNARANENSTVQPQTIVEESKGQNVEQSDSTVQWQEHNSPDANTKNQGVDDSEDD